MVASSLLANLLSIGGNLEDEFARSDPGRHVHLGRSSPSDGNLHDSAGSALLLNMVDCYGDNQALLARKINRLASQCEEFIRRFGDGPVRILRAPARINILGEHVDYVSYIPTSSLTFGSREHDMVMMFRKTADGLVRGTSTDSRFEDFEFKLGNGFPDHPEPAPGAEWLSYLYSRPAPRPNWANYTEGACRFAQIKYGAKISAGFDFLIDSSVPPGGGASSSSALCVLSGAALRLVNGIQYNAEELALDSSQAEWYVGTRGGSMDHTTIMLARPDSAIQISYSSGESSWLRMSGGYSWVTFFTHPANKSQEVLNQYNDRALVSRIVIPAIVSGWESTTPRLSQLFSDGVSRFSTRDFSGLALIEAALQELPETISVGYLYDAYPAAFELARQAFPTLIESAASWQLQVRKRALHHIGEVKRVARAAEVLSSLRGREEAGPVVSPAVSPNGSPVSPNVNPNVSDDAAAKIGVLLQESHSSLRDLYEVSSPEVEELVEIIKGSGLAFGARMMGGGFGGNVLALARGPNSPHLIDFVQEKYYSPRNRDASREGAIMVSTPGPGFSEIDSGSGQPEY